MYSKKIFFLVIFWFNVFLSFSQNNQIGREIDTNYLKSKINILEKKISLNNKLPKKYKLQTLIVLLYYSELEHINITFKNKNLKTSLACRPKIGFIFKKKSKRKYIIFINNKSKKLENVLLKNVPFNAQVGVISHEIAHIVDYSKKSNLQVIKTAINYLSIKKREKFEKSIDSIAIKHGFGWQLYDWADYILNKSKVSDKYKNYKRLIYLEPQEILGKIK
ncbi:MAG: hypothetical protein JXR51_02065 [Bacteroidales bacterium]|nr:hypothetical protein [Bacteroidales bacterium]MBN2755932.1 hypothetical protein [Bacteroidales bacterium]